MNYHAVGILVLVLSLSRVIQARTDAEFCTVNITQEVKEYLKSGSTVFEVILKNESPKLTVTDLLLLPYTPFAHVEGMKTDRNGISLLDPIPPLGTHRWSYTLYGPKPSNFEIVRAHCKNMQEKPKRTNEELMDPIEEGEEAVNEGYENGEEAVDEAYDHGEEAVNEAYDRGVEEFNHHTSDDISDLQDPFDVAGKSAKNHHHDSQGSADNHHSHESQEDNKHHHQLDHSEESGSDSDNRAPAPKDMTSGLPDDYDPENDPELKKKNHHDSQENKHHEHTPAGHYQEGKGVEAETGLEEKNHHASDDNNRELTPKHHVAGHDHEGEGGNNHHQVDEDEYHELAPKHHGEGSEKEAQHHHHHHSSEESESWSDSDSDYHHHEHRPKNHGEGSHEENDDDDEEEVYKHHNHEGESGEPVPKHHGGSHDESESDESDAIHKHHNHEESEGEEKREEREPHATLLPRPTPPQRPTNIPPVNPPL